MTRQPDLRLSMVNVRIPIDLPAHKREDDDPHVSLEVYREGIRCWDSATYTACGDWYRFDDSHGPFIYGLDQLPDMPYFDHVYRYLVEQHAAHRGDPLGAFLRPAVAAMDQAICKRTGSRVYFAQAGDRIKIGWSRNVAARIAKLQTGNPEPIILLATRPGGRSLEQELHDRFAEARLTGEWFSSSPDLLTYVRSLQLA